VNSVDGVIRLLLSGLAYGVFILWGILPAAGYLSIMESRHLLGQESDENFHRLVAGLISLGYWGVVLYLAFNRRRAS